jgi:hypothetical protein
MSDPRLTAAQVQELLERNEGDDVLRLIQRIGRSHEAYRADVERLTAEHAALKTSDSQRVILEMLLSAIDTVLLGNEVSDFEESFPPVRQVIDLKDERDHLRAEHAALREELDALVAALDVAMCETCDQGIRRGHAPDCPHSLDGIVAALVAERDALKVELAEARAEIARMKRLALEATNGWACRATREIELDEISRLHQEISSRPTPPAERKEPR